MKKGEINNGGLRRTYLCVRGEGQLLMTAFVCLFFSFLFDLDLPKRSRRLVRWKVKMEENCRETEENFQFKLPVINFIASCLIA